MESTTHIKIPIIKGDVVLHTLSNLYFICENDQQARWMNLPFAFYIPVPADVVPKSYFDKK